jgi:hypothetical protein
LEPKLIIKRKWWHSGRKQRCGQKLNKKERAGGITEGAAGNESVAAAGNEAVVAKAK